VDASAGGSGGECDTSADEAACADVHVLGARAPAMQRAQTRGRGGESRNNGPVG